MHDHLFLMLSSSTCQLLSGSFLLFMYY
uniref:Uncharacterized protein n=2 Tax=Anguilla anguilla TaxID=7936 RepID=A0A0E9XWP3_ANGAN